MIEPNILAFQNAELLAALEDRPTEGWTRSTLAARLDRDPSNTMRALKALAEANLVHAEPMTDGLTDAGREQLAAYRRAQHGGEKRRARGQWPIDKFRPNPLNRPVRREVLADMAASMRGPAGLVQRVIATEPDANGVRMLIDGEHRWEAAKLLLAQVAEDPFGKTPDWLTDGMPFEEAEADPATALVITLVANARRADMSPWEDAQQLLKLQQATDWSAAELARQIGRVKEGETSGLRDVQQKLKIAREATPQAIADYERTGSWDALRASVSTPKAPDRLGPSDELSQALAEHGPATGPRAQRTDAQREWLESQKRRIWPAIEALSPKHLLVLVEVADLIVRRPTDNTATYEAVCGESYPDPTKCAQHLVENCGLGFTHLKGHHTVTLADATFDWLLAKGYVNEPGGADAQRLALLRQQALGVGAEAKLRHSGRYWTEWLVLSEAAKPSGPHVVNGVDYGNATRANEARRALGILPPLPSPNYGGGSRTTEEAEDVAPYVRPHNRTPVPPLPAPSAPATSAPAPAPAPANLMSAHLKGLAIARTQPAEAALQLIREERLRQIEVEGFSPQTDAEQNGDFELAQAAAAYASAYAGDRDAALFWPGGWDPAMFKPTGGFRDLVRAAALIVAELERLAAGLEAQA